MKTIRHEFPWGTIEWLASGELGNAAELSLARMTLAPGQAIDTHCHDNAEESVYVVRGTVECRMQQGTTLRLAAGEAGTIPRGTVHTIACVGGEPAELVLNYSSAARGFRLAPGGAP
jgi:quercetin dioxygenase-like cupin family protein